MITDLLEPGGHVSGGPEIQGDDDAHGTGEAGQQDAKFPLQ